MQIPQTEIIITRDGAQIASHVFQPGEYTIGRGEGCEILIEDEELSRHHARLTLNFDHALIEDLGSQHGTFVNEKPVTEATRLWPNQKIRVGRSTILTLRRLKNDDPTQLAEDPARATIWSLLPQEFLREKKYDIGEVVAQGGMGAILRAQEATTERTVAMKVMLAGDNPSLLVRFVVEAKVTAQLEHPNIVPVHELGVDENDQVFYTMKFVSGITLRKVLESLAEGDAEMIRKYPLPHLLTVFQKLCDAVAFAHSKGVLHRDLKPENIMLGDFGEVLLMDWGLAKVLGREYVDTPSDDVAGAGQSYDSRASKTMVGMVLGTPRYMSPEQARGEVETLDGRADVYALGAILYHMLALRTAVEGRADTVVEKVARGEIAPLTTPKQKSHLPGGRIPDSLAAVVKKAMALDREARYATVEALQADITAYQDGFATSAEAAGLMRQMGLLVQRHKREFVIGFAAWLVITGLGVWFVINLRASELRAQRGEALALASDAKSKISEANAKDEEAKAKKSAKVALQKEEEAQRALAKAQIAAADAAFRNADGPSMTQALEVCPKEYRDQSWDYLWAKRDGSLGPLKIAGFESPASITSVPGKSGLFAFASRRGEIGFVDAASRKLVRTWKTDRGELRRVDFSGDGRLAAVTYSSGNDLELYVTASGAKLRTIGSPGEEFKQAALSHDGALLATVTATQTQQVELSLIETRDGHARWRRLGHFAGVAISPDGSRITLAGGVLANRQFVILNADDGREAAKLGVIPACQAMSPDGKFVVVGTPQGEVTSLDLATGAEIQHGRLYVGTLSGLAWTADGHLVSMGTEGRFRSVRPLLRLWGSDYLTPEASLFGFKNGLPWSLNPESGFLITEESPPRLWRLPVGRELVKMEHRSEQGWSICFLSDTVLLGRKDFSLGRYDLSTPGRATLLPGAFPERYTFGVSHPASGLFAICSRVADKRFFGFKIFSSQGNAVVEKLNRPSNEMIVDLAFDATAERIAAAYRSGGIEIFSVKTGELLLKIKGRFERVAFAGSGKNLIGLSAQTRPRADDVEYALVLLDGATGRPITNTPISFRVGALAVSADRKLVAIAGSDQLVHLFDANTLHERSAFRAHDGEIGALAFHPSLPVVASASADGSVKLWDYNSAHLLDSFVGLGGTPVAAAFSPNGRLLAVDGQERTSRVYDVSGVGVAEGGRP